MILPAGISICSTSPRSPAPGRCATSSDKIGPQDRVLVIGDTRQHQGVDAGKPFEQMQDAGMRTSLLETIVRQKDPALLAAVEKLSRNETADGVSMLKDQGRVRQIVDREERIRRDCEETTLPSRKAQSSFRRTTPVAAN